MSRWHDNFKTHAFQTTWRAVQDLLEDLEVTDESVTTDVEEMSRAIRVIGYLDELLNQIDPELTPPQTWDNFQKQAAACVSQLTAFQQNKDIGHVQNANAHLDNLLTYVRPYAIAEGSAADAMKAAFEAYLEFVTKSIPQMEVAAKNSLKNIRTIETKSNKVEVIIDESKSKVAEFEDELFSDKADQASLKSRISNLSTEIETLHTRFSEYHTQLLGEDDNAVSISAKIADAKKTAIADVETIRSEFATQKKNLEDLGVLHTEVFGVEDAEGQTSGGLKKEISERREEISDLHQSQSKTYDAMWEKIEDLLPGATSAGLASAYKDLKDSYQWIIIRYSGLFFLSMTLLFVVSASFIFSKFGIDGIEFVKIDSLPAFGSNFVMRAPLLVPIIWLGYFASKRRSEAQRLQQEYAHKEALAKSYDSYRTQIEELEVESHDLRIELLRTAISAIAFNASTTLDGKHGDKSPLQSSVDGLLGAGS